MKRKLPPKRIVLEFLGRDGCQKPESQRGMYGETKACSAEQDRFEVGSRQLLQLKLDLKLGQAHQQREIEDTRQKRPQKKKNQRGGDERKGEYKEGDG